MWNGAKVDYSMYSAWNAVDVILCEYIRGAIANARIAANQLITEEYDDKYKVEIGPTTECPNRLMISIWRVDDTSQDITCTTDHTTPTPNMELYGDAVELGY